MLKIRNFSIIAHIDHGKSTLADRLLEYTGTISKEKLTPQYLDSLDLERERGITIKLAPVTMNYQDFVFNLIDTPGHVDFSYEVSRSLACVEGVILLVDAIKGVEAQTLSNLLLAREQSKKIIPVINKIDMQNAQISEVSKQLVDLGFIEDAILKVSAKTGQGVEDLLKTIAAKIPAPTSDSNKPLRALVFDSSYDQFKGVIAYVRLFDGKISKDEKIHFLGTGQTAEAASLGFFAPELKEKEALSSGEIGWIATGLKEVEEVRVGDTITLLELEKLGVKPLPGYKEFKPMVFAGIFPVNRDEFNKLKEALAKLKLNDASLIFEPESSAALGFGVRAGFLGLLHMEIVQERLEREFDLELIMSAPTVRYEVDLTDGQQIEISNPQDLPEPSRVKLVSEPWLRASIVSQQRYLGPINQVLYSHRCLVKNVEYLAGKIQISCELPLAEIISQFYDQLKTVSSGFASFDYEPVDYRPVKVAKLEILVAGEPVDALFQIVLKDKAFATGKALVNKLKEVIPRQQYEVSLQAAIAGKIIAAERISAFRKDVTAKLYGGDRTRKDKLLDKQKKGKQRMKMVGKVSIPQEAFLSVLKI